MITLQISAISSDVINKIIDQFISPHSLEEQWDVAGLESHLQRDFLISLPIKSWLEQNTELHEESLRKKIVDAFTETYQCKVEQVGTDVMHQIEKSVMLQILDTLWKEHLCAMDQLREGIHLRGYAAQNPKQEYKRESFKMFSQLLENVKHDTLRTLYILQVRSEEDVQKDAEMRRRALEQEQRKMNFIHSSSGALPEDEITVKDKFQRVGRNDACPCGSNKKFKHCHGKLV